VALNDAGWKEGTENGGLTLPPATSAEGLPAQWRVLFVAGDALWFGQLQQDLACLQPDWVCLHAADSVEAVKILTATALEALVVDGQTPNARPLIEAVREQRPEILCLIRCEMSDPKAVDLWKGLGIPLMASHADATTLAASLLRRVHLREWMAEPAIKALLPKIRKLPATPKLYTQVTAELRDPNGSLEVIAALIGQDPVMSAKLLQLVNSAFFASSREVTNLLEAVIILGTDRIRTLILLAGIFSQYAGNQGVASSVQRLLGHSIQVGVFARAIALSEAKSGPMAEAAFTAGVLHDVGKLILAGNLPEMFIRVQALMEKGKLSERAAERQVYGVNHAKVGACLLAGWGLPLPILEAIAFHHEPERSADKTFSLLAAVHAANIFAHQTESPPPAAAAEAPPGLHLGYLAQIGLGDRVERWRGACGLRPLGPAGATPAPA
jgi:putative nucleotidyltransferase with HDIG domain